MKAFIILDFGNSSSVGEVDVKSITKNTIVYEAIYCPVWDINELVNRGAGITFLKDRFHVCISRKYVESIKFE